MKILHLSDIHMGSGFAHGRIDPETGQNTRLHDFAKALSRAIDRAIAEPVDLVLFGGDAFPDATPAPYIQQAFAEQFYRLVVANIPLVLLVGNHDRHAQGQGGSQPINLPIARRTRCHRRRYDYHTQNKYPQWGNSDPHHAVDRQIYAAHA
jgi:exonuclease SbcD